MPPPEKGGGKEKNMFANLLSAAGTAVSVAIAVAAVGIVVLTVVLHFVRKKEGQNGLRVRLLRLCGLFRLPYRCAKEG